MISPIDEIVEAARAGHPVIMIDAETRKNEGHLILPAQFVDADAVNFMAIHCRGIVSLALTGAQAEALGRLPEGVSRNDGEAVRDWDRGLLWSTLTGGHQRPAPADSDPVVDAAIAHVARAPSALAIVPLEDLLGLDEQPNLPGTTVEHPNWRRRLDAPVEELLADPAVTARIDTLARR